MYVGQTASSFNCQYEVNCTINVIVHITTSTAIIIIVAIKKSNNWFAMG